MMEVSRRLIRAIDTQIEVLVEASVDDVWRALTDDIGGWWPREFYADSTARAFVVEARVGGRVYEDWGDGDGALWGMVVACRRPRILQWAGDLAADFGGPTRSVTSFRLEEHEGGTRVTLRDTPFGAVADDCEEEIEGSWRYLLADCLKPFVEGDRPDEEPAN
ncbi:MAG: SRPBCC domain-containing protein [Acidobacteriota bacterium]